MGLRQVNKASAEIRAVNEAINRGQLDPPQTKRESDYRVQRDRLAQVLRKVLATRRSLSAAALAAAEDARKVLAEIYRGGNS